MPQTLLILGGTGFLGPHVARVAVAAGMRVTLFHRGKTVAEDMPPVETISGDRNTDDLKRLEGRAWDAVIDTCGYFPRQVRASAGLLSKTCGLYVFVSSVSAYRSFDCDEITDDSAVFNDSFDALDKHTEITGETYGALKAGCEREAEAAFGDRCWIVRPGLIVGPGDATDRFTYWPVRMERGGRVLAPGDGGDAVQWIDARDLAAFLIDGVSRGFGGRMNTTGPAAACTLREFLETCRRVCNPKAELVWVSTATLTLQGIRPWSDLPMWAPGDGMLRGISRARSSRALAAGLSLRPLEDILRDTLAWHRTRTAGHRLKAGLTPEREAGILSVDE